MRRLITTLLVLSSSVAAADEEPEPAAAPASIDVSTGRPAEKGAFGVGIVLGEPTGLCAKLYLDDDTAIQGALGFNVYDTGIQVNAEYVFHPWIVQERDAFVLPIYFGPGVRFIQYDGGRDGEEHYAVGLRGVVGMLFDFKEVPLDVFLEVAGVLEYDFTEDAGAALNLGAGVRYYF